MTPGTGFLAFHAEAPDVAAAHLAFVQAHAAATALDEKTEELAYLAVLAAQRMGGGIPFHVAQARAKGASRAEVASAVLVGLPAVGLTVLDALPIALAAFDEAEAATAAG